MLTAELVRATRRGSALRVTALRGKAKQRAEELARCYLELAQAHVGASRGELLSLWGAVEAAARETKLCAGLQKLVADCCEFESESALEPRKLRAEVFLAAAEARRESTFDRAQLLQAVGAPHGLGAQEVEVGLYADLKSEHRLLSPPAVTAARLVERYELAQLQAVLLRAVRVRANIECETPAEYRELFRKLKFRRLLFQVHPEPAGGYRIDIDGPFSLFESVTKYGLQLALILPTLLLAKRLRLHAALRWGKERTPLDFELERESQRPDRSEPAPLPDEVQRLLASFEGGRQGWKARRSTEIINLPGVGVCVPDLLFHHESGNQVLLEVLGYWSREAVWRRVELAEHGLPHKLLFAASQRLRVSEAVLDDSASASLYVYKGAMVAKAVVEHLDALAAR